MSDSPVEDKDDSLLEGATKDVRALVTDVIGGTECEEFILEKLVSTLASYTATIVAVTSIRSQMTALQGVLSDLEKLPAVSAGVTWAVQTRLKSLIALMEVSEEQIRSTPDDSNVSEEKS